MTKKIKGINPHLNLKKDPHDKSKPIQFEHPIFCLKFLHKDFSLDQCDKNDKSALVDQIYKLSQMTWKDIMLAPKHGMGSEKISSNSLKATVNGNFSEDETILALRFSGKKPMVGIKRNNIFHILFLDIKFSLYNH
ncbi:MAG: hypothetical protein ACRCU6_00235 [Fusobacteriaceae bacterium]